MHVYRPLLHTFPYCLRLYISFISHVIFCPAALLLFWLSNLALSCPFEDILCHLAINSTCGAALGLCLVPNRGSLHYIGPSVSSRNLRSGTHVVFLTAAAPHFTFILPLVLTCSSCYLSLFFFSSSTSPLDGTQLCVKVIDCKSHLPSSLSFLFPSLQMLLFIARISL